MSDEGSSEGRIVEVWKELCLKVLSECINKYKNISS